MLGLFSLFGMLLMGLGLDAISGERDVSETDEHETDAASEQADETARQEATSMGEEAAAMLEDFQAEFRAETGLFGEHGLTSLFGTDCQGADSTAGSTEVDETAELPVIEGYDPADERLLVGYDPDLSDSPEIEVETLASDEGGTSSVIRLDGAAVAYVMQAPGTAQLAVEDVALVPVSVLAEAC